MVNDESLIREVDEGLAEDDFARTLRDRAPVLIGAAAAIVVGVAGWQFYGARKVAAADDAARRFSEATENLENQPGENLSALEAFAESAPAGYRAIAQLRLASAYAGQGDRAKALATYRALYGAGDIGRLDDLARVRAAYLAFEEGRDAVLRDIGDLDQDASPLGYFAREAVALAALKAGDYQTAESMFAAFEGDPETPPGVRARANEFRAIASAARAGAPLIWPDIGGGADTIFDAIDADSGDLGAILQNAKRAADEAAAAAAVEEVEEDPPAEGASADDAPAAVELIPDDQAAAEALQLSPDAAPDAQAADVDAGVGPAETPPTEEAAAVDQPETKTDGE